MKVTIDPEKCQGHGRGFGGAPDLFDSAELGQGIVIGDGTVAAGREEAAKLAEANCPEYAIEITE